MTDCPLFRAAGLCDIGGVLSPWHRKAAPYPHLRPPVMTAVVAFVDPRDLTYADLGARLRVSGPGFSPEKFAGCTVLIRSSPGDPRL